MLVVIKGFKHEINGKIRNAILAPTEYGTIINKGKSEITIIDRHRTQFVASIAPNRIITLMFLWARMLLLF